VSEPGLRPAYPIRTARLDLRPHRMSDLEDLLVFHSSPLVTRYIPWPVRDRDQVRDALTVKLEQGELPEPGRWLVLALELRETGRVVGEVLLKWASAPDRQGELGYALAEEVWGRGLAVEAATAMLGLAFTDLGLHRVCAVLVADNTASAAVLVKLGMRHEATFSGALRWEGAWADELVYAITAPEWAARTG
jgi:RimJ/RimL family protein N-acetyltransferase